MAEQIERISEEVSGLAEHRERDGLPREVDLVLEVKSAPGFPLTANDIHQLSTGREHDVRVLFAKPGISTDGQKQTTVLLHVPFGHLTGLRNKILRYANETTDRGHTPNPWVANLHSIARAAFESMWTDPEALPGDDEPRWWELWVRRSDANWTAFQRYADQARLARADNRRLILPEHYVVVAQARRSQLEGSFDLLNTLAEIRLARLCHYELSTLSAVEQQEWIELAIQRITIPSSDAPAVCVLDAGVNRGHPLLHPLLSPADNQTIFPDRDASDSEPNAGHGTPMAGLAAYGDLRNLMLSNGPWAQRHLLESVKLLDHNRPHHPANYGAVTVQAVSLAEIQAPRRSRVFVMPVTADNPLDGRPTSWSAAIDSLAYGDDTTAEPKRLFIISAGNTNAFDEGFRYPDDNLAADVEDPAQSWNALSVGAVTRRTRIQETDPESSRLQSVAQKVGALSPHSRTSLNWDSRWPIKPDIVMEGGNLCAGSGSSLERRDSLDLISTSKNVHGRPLCPFRATSAASALAAHLAAQISAEYPMVWPETIRGLMVHSARWNDAITNGANPHRAGTRRSELEKILRTYGHGEPDLGRARFSSQQAVTLFREDEFVPYSGTAGSATVNDCHVHRLQLPARLLQSVGDVQAKMRITLSYFVAPNPSTSNRIPGSRYNYAGCLLRFRVRHRDETEDNFLSLVSRGAEDGDDDEEEPDSMHDRGWALGPKLRGKGGSLIHDVWEGSAADLVTMNQIAVYPVKGWWAFRSFPRNSPWFRCHRRKVRYSLIVSIEVSADVHLYSEISNLLSVPIDAT